MPEGCAWNEKNEKLKIFHTVVLPMSDSLVSTTTLAPIRFHGQNRRFSANNQEAEKKDLPLGNFITVIILFDKSGSGVIIASKFMFDY